MRWLVTTAAVAVMAWGCGGGGGGEADAKELVEAAVDAVVERGMVFHAKSDEGTEFWIDGEKELFRSQGGDEEERFLTVSVGEELSVATESDWKNGVETRVLELPGELTPLTDHPPVVWWSPLGVLAYGQDVKVVGEKVSEGRDVVVVETRSTMKGNDRATGSISVWRVELDRESHLLVATEWCVIRQEGERGEDEECVNRVVYEGTEFIPREELPEDFFSPEALSDKAAW